MNVEPKIRGLYAITDSAWNPCGSLPVLVQKFLEGGAKIVQLRVKDGRTDDILEIAKQIMVFKKKWGFTFIINDHADIAAAIGADGVHVGKNDARLSDIKRSFGSKLIVGYSSHSIGEARLAVAGGADYVAFGAIYPTMTKGPGHPVQGVEKLKELVNAVTVPVVAIGGIGRDNIDEVISAGVRSTAMITALSQAEDIVSETKWFVDKFK